MSENPHFVEKEIHGEFNSGILATGFDERITGLANDYTTGNSQNLHMLEHIIHEHERKLRQVNLEKLIKGSATAGSRTYSVSDFFAKSKSPLTVFFPGAVAAYSLRNLQANNEVGTNPIKIRRESDNVEVNVSFDINGKISTSSPITNVDDEPVVALTSIGTSWSVVAGAAGYFASTPLTVGGTYSTPFKARVSLGETVASGSKITISGSVSSITGSNWVIYPAQSDNSIAVSSGTSITSTGVFFTTLTLNADAEYVIIENSSGSENITLSGGLGASTTAGDTTDTNLGDFISGTNAFVVTWYDQSGNGDDVEQDTLTRQAKIADSSSGLLVDSDGNAYLEFDGTDDFYNANKTIFNNVSYGYISTVAQYDDANAANEPVYFASTGTSGTQTRAGLGKFNISGAKLAAAGRRLDTDAFRSSTETADTNKNILTGLFQWAEGHVRFYLNGAAKTAGSFSSGAGNTSATDSNSAFIGRLSSSYYAGRLYEIIIYNTDQVGNREALESNMANEYGITLS